MDRTHPESADVIRLMSIVGTRPEAIKQEAIIPKAPIPIRAWSIFRKKPAPDLIRGGYRFSAENATT